MDSENLRAARKRCMEQQALASALVMAARLSGVWMALRRFDDAREWLVELLDDERARGRSEGLAVRLGMTHGFWQIGEFDSATAPSNALIER